MQPLTFFGSTNIYIYIYIYIFIYLFPLSSKRLTFSSPTTEAGAVCFCPAWQARCRRIGHSEWTYAATEQIGGELAASLSELG